MDYRVQSILDLMESNLRRNVTLSEMAQHVNITPEHLCRVFKSETGDAPVRYLKRLRLQRAKELLETTCLRVKEIMAMVGVNDGSHFVQDFELAFGLTPSNYRALHQGVDLSQVVPAQQGIKIG